MERWATLLRRKLENLSNYLGPVSNDMTFQPDKEIMMVVVVSILHL